MLPIKAVNCQKVKTIKQLKNEESKLTIIQILMTTMKVTIKTNGFN